MQVVRSGVARAVGASSLAAAIVWLAAGAARATVIISELDLATSKVELVNTGSSNEDISSWWFCNRVNGSPFYSTVASYSIDTSLSTASSLSLAPGDILVINLSSAILPVGNGELGLYNTNSFASSSAIEDYLLYGSNGARDVVAQNAGLWIDNDSIDISGSNAGETIQLGLALPGNSAADYFLEQGSLGVAQSVPEPGTGFLLAVGLTWLATSTHKRSGFARR